MPHLLWQSGSLEHLTLGVCIIQLVKDWDRRYQCLERLQNTRACYEIIPKQNGTLIINGYLKISFKKIRHIHVQTNQIVQWICTRTVNVFQYKPHCRITLKQSISSFWKQSTINNIDITQISTITTKLIIFQAHQKKAPNNIIISSLSHQYQLIPLNLFIFF